MDTVQLDTMEETARYFCANPGMIMPESGHDVMWWAGYLEAVRDIKRAAAEGYIV